MFDSLGGKHRETAQQLRKWVLARAAVRLCDLPYVCSCLNLLAKEKYQVERDFTDQTMPLINVKVPQQDNLTDCGVFMISFVQSFLSGGTDQVGKLSAVGATPIGFPCYSPSRDMRLDYTPYFAVGEGDSIPLTREMVRRYASPSIVVAVL